MTKLFRRSGMVYQRHPINGPPDGTVSAPLPKVTGTGSVFDVGTTGTAEADRDKLYSAGFFSPAADFEGRYVLLQNTPKGNATNDSGIYGGRMENWIVRIASVDPSGDFVRLEGMRFEDPSTTISFTVLAAADFTAASANFPAEPHTINDAGPVVHQVIVFPNPANKTLQIAPFPIGKRNSANSVRISDLYGVLGSFPTESSLEWYLKDRPAFSTFDLFKIIHQNILDTGWQLEQWRGTNQVNEDTWDDIVYRSDGEDSRKKMTLRFGRFSQNNQGMGSDTNNTAGIEFAMFAAWDRSFVHINPAGQLQDGAGVNPLWYHFNVTSSSTHFWAGWFKDSNTSNQEPQWCADMTNGSPFPDQDFDKWGDHDTFIEHPMGDPKGGSFVEYDYMFFGDKDEIHIFVFAEGRGVTALHLGSMEPLPSQIQVTPFTLQGSVTAGSNVVLRVGSTEDPANLSPGPSYQVGDNIQIVGQKVNSVDADGESHTGEFIESAFIQGIGPVGATGRINCVAKSLLVDDVDSFTIDDGEGNIVTFYYNLDAVGGGTGTPIDVSGDTSAADVAASTAVAITGSLLNIAATLNGDGVNLLHNTPNSAATNVQITEAVNDPGFTVRGMEGSGFGITVDILQESYEKGALVGEDPQPMFIAAPLHYSTVYENNSGQVKVSNRSRHNDPTYRDHNGQNDARHLTFGGFTARLDRVPRTEVAQLDPSQRTGRFGLLGVIVNDVTGDQWRGRLRYYHVLSKRITNKRFIRDRDGQYYYVVPMLQRFNNNPDDTVGQPIAIGPMPQPMAIPS